MPLFFKTNLSVDILQRLFLQHKIYSVRVCIKKPSCDLVVCCILRSWQTRTHCCGHIVADTNVSPFAQARNICCGHKKCFCFVQKYFVSATYVSQFAQPKEHHGQQCVRNKVSSFTRVFKSCNSVLLLARFAFLTNHTHTPSKRIGSRYFPALFTRDFPAFAARGDQTSLMEY